MMRLIREEGPRAVALGVLGLLMLGVSVAVAVDMVRSSRDMGQRIEQTEALLDADPRVLGQVQRQLLRLELLLREDRRGDDGESQDAKEIRVITRSVTDLAHEVALPEQRPLLGSEVQLELARENEQSWLDQIRPQVREALGTGARARDVRLAAIQGIGRLEDSYNQLSATSEVARRERVDATDETTAEMLWDIRRMLVLLSILFVAGTTFSVVGAVLLVRTNRHRLAALRHLEDLNEELTFYSRVVQATDSALMATDESGHLTWVNEAFERTTGYRLDEIRGRRTADFLSGETTSQEVLRQIEEAGAKGLPIRAELAQYTATGKEFWVSLDLAPLHSDTGELEGFFGVLTDITERHEAEELLDQARKAAEASAQEKAGFLATMSHEIRTPLNAVLGLTDLLLLTELDDEQRDYTETAHQSGNHLLALVNDVLDYSALEAGRLEYADVPFSMAQLLDETLTMFVANAEAKGIELRLRQSPDVPAALLGDSMRMRQVLVNVVGNAMKFTEQGSVSVDCDLVGSPWGHRVEIVLRVSDTGIGIPRWRIPDLFRSFVRGDASSTRQYGGTGLGLAISRRLVEAMGGTIDLESEVGVGTTVTIRMVYDRVAEQPPPVPRPAQAILDHSERRVLVAEDDVVNQKVVVRMLGRLGIEPTVVENGREAVEAVRTGAFDTVLMDVEMPVMDGLRAVRLIRDTDLQVQPWIVALTANALSGDRDRFLSAGMDDYVSKPVTLDALTAALDRSRSGHAPD
ncbi:MAG TPA: ATP-binding protein [Nocardioides sp.]|uniref:hybrid sensor histidine kinase/response regulator n=1 Tax=Nocardioides sp. TaxID=35761 RepID=UPI002CBCD562|nr:ATP-binding protein [Nocardioides sp.]HTW14680.1 ATP-binding protein [Nocardioides sp.]